jgi:hypothetical protein
MHELSLFVPLIVFWVVFVVALPTAAVIYGFRRRHELPTALRYGLYAGMVYLGFIILALVAGGVMLLAR